MVMSADEIEEALVGVGMPADRAHRVALAIDRAENAATVEDVQREVSHAREILQGEIERLAVQQDAKISELRSELKQDNARIESRTERIESRVERLDERIRELEERFEQERAEARARHRQLMIVAISIGVTLGTGIVSSLIAILLMVFGAV